MQEYPSCASLGAISNKSVIFFVRNAEILTTCQLFGGLALCNQEKNGPVATCLTLHIAVQPSTKWILHRPNTSPFSLCDNGVSQSIQYQFIYCSHVLKCITSPETAGKQQPITRGFLPMRIYWNTADTGSETWMSDSKLFTWFSVFHAPLTSQNTNEGGKCLNSIWALKYDPQLWL